MPKRSNRKISLKSQSLKIRSFFQDKKRVDKTFEEFLDDENLQLLKPLLYASNSVQGYGRLDEIPTLYGMTWNTPKMMGVLLKRLSGDNIGGM